MATEVRALESGAVDFITKPVKMDILRHRIELHLQFAQYQQQLESVVAELEDSIITAFADLIDCRGKGLYRHEEHLGCYLELICRTLLACGDFAEELDEAQICDLIRAAPLHDIGKIGISDVIMLKPGKLSEEEYAAVKEHPLIGGRVLRSIHERLPAQVYLSCAAQLAEGHHERYDGLGYPHGLAGTEIPLGCRIMAVANVYAALVSDCAFRKAMSHEDACRIVLEGRGTAFDPKVVRAFEKVMDKLVAYCKSGS
jgi:putative two-component system response regulator